MHTCRAFSGKKRVRLRTENCIARQPLARACRMRKYTWIWCDEINIEQFMWGRKKLQWAGNKVQSIGIKAAFGIQRLWWRCNCDDYSSM
jgi:hypothetical protein